MCHEVYDPQRLSPTRWKPHKFLLLFYVVMGGGDRMVGGGGIGLDIPTSIDIYNMYIVHT
jgi:hypothetical protein